MKIMAKIKNFTKQALAFMAGDTDGVIASQNYRKCSATLESQIAVLKGKKVDLEESVNEAKQHLEKAKYPAEKVSDGSTWLRSVVRSKEALKVAEDALQDCEESITFYQNILAEYNEEVEETEA